MKVKINTQMILFLVILLLVVFIYILNKNKKNEGLCNKNCKPSSECSVNDCSGSDLSNCLIGLKSCPEPKPAEPIKCIADFGTSVGDPLCCGQEGVLQDTKYVCPNTLQKCSNFKCGSAFGSCVSK